MNKYSQILIFIAIVIIVYGLYNCNCKKGAKYTESFVPDLSIEDIKKKLNDKINEINTVGKNNEELLKQNIDQNKMVNDFNSLILKSIKHA